MIIHFKKCSRKVLREMIEGFYDIKELDHPIWDHPEIDEKWSPAEVNQILFRNFEDPQQAMDELLQNDVTNPLLKKEDVDSTPLKIDHIHIPETQVEDQKA